MLCSRSASLTSSTRTSAAIASRSLRRFSACFASLRDEVELLQLGQALDQRADLVAEQLVDLGARRLGVLDRVVQQRRDDRGVVELEVGEDRRDFERMGEIGIARGARLRAMRLHGVDIGAVEQILVGVRIVALTRSTRSYCRIICGRRPSSARLDRPGAIGGAGSTDPPRRAAGSACAADRSGRGPCVSSGRRRRAARHCSRSGYHGEFALAGNAIA